MHKKNYLITTTLFWILFFLLNTVLFFPSFLTNVNQVTGQLDLGKDTTFWEQLSFGNFELLMQLSGELLIFLVPFLFLKKESVIRKVYMAIIGIAYLLLLYYNIYYEGYRSLYSVHPIFASDWIIIKDILPTFFKEISIKSSTYLLIFTAYLTSSILLFCGILWMQNCLTKVRTTSFFWIPVVLSVFLGFLQFSNVEEKLTDKEKTIEEKKEKTILSENEEDEMDNYSIDSTNYDFIKWVYPDMLTSATLERKDPLKHLKKRFLYDVYMEKKLVERPNIYLLFIESYGGVATFTDYCAKPFHKLATQLDSKLDSAGWTIASNYTKSSVIGGRSWLAMTTAMIGAQIEDQVQYDGLIKEQTTYPHMIDFFNTQGYDTYRVSSMKVRKIDTLNMITIPNRFWKFDHRYFFPDLGYKGFVYDHFGGIPDQYTFGYVENEILSKAKEPYFLSLITMNSHGSWSNLSPPLVDDWRTLNDMKNPFGKEKQTFTMHISDYWKAIDYQLRMVTDFILKNGDEKSVFIILGDHNPGGLEWKLFNKFNKWATPIHIISKDSTFVHSFHQHGFTEGVVVDTSQYTIMRHKGLYSLLARQLLENYGEKDVVLPEYLPWGL